jgi:nucleotide-binding universal stress UspA family protein
MYLQIVMPTDGSDASLQVFPVAKRLGLACDAPVVVMTVVGPDENADEVRSQLRARLDERQESFDPVVDQVLIAQGAAPAEAILAELERVPGSLLCLRSTGRVHTEPFLGLVTEDVLRGTTGVAVLVGPEVDTDAWQLDGPLVLCTDGSATAGTMAPVAAQWGIAMGVDVCVVSVTPPGTPAVGDTSDIALPAHLAHELQREIGRTVDYDSLHGDDVAESVVRYATDRGAALVAAATHGRTGLKRIALGSTVMAIVHRSPVPVLTQRPPDFAQEH